MVILPARGPADTEVRPFGACPVGTMEQVKVLVVVCIELEA